MHRQRVRSRGTVELFRPLAMDRFLAQLAPPNKRGCRLWTGTLSKAGYGRFHTDGRERLAHRWIYEQQAGRKLAKEEFVMHSCDTPACCELTHLNIGTAADNNRDRDEKGRTRARSGPTHPNAVLDEEKVRAIRALQARGFGYRRQSRILGIQESAIKGVLEGRTWKHVA